MVPPGFLGIKSLRQTLVAEWWVPAKRRTAGGGGAFPLGSPSAGFPAPFSLQSSVPAPNFAMPVTVPMANQNALPFSNPGGSLVTPSLVTSSLTDPRLLSPQQPALQRNTVSPALPQRPASAGTAFSRPSPWWVFRQCKRNWANPEERKERKQKATEGAPLDIQATVCRAPVGELWPGASPQPTFQRWGKNRRPAGRRAFRHGSTLAMCTLWVDKDRQSWAYDCVGACPV